jgi:myo-inositol-1(or 4)-monophosphatase
MKRRSKKCCSGHYYQAITAVRMKNECNPKDVLPFLQHVSEQAGQTLLSYFRKEFRVDRKDTRPGGIDIVTDADRASEEIILEAIGREFPDHDVLTEETPTERTGSRYLWLIDPLDGTVNFAHGFPVFCVSMALAENRTILAGIVHDPLRNESFHAVRGHGAFVNGDQIHVSLVDRLESCLFATGFPYDISFSPDNNLSEFSRVAPKVQGMRRAGSAAIDLAYVASARFDGFWELKLNPWDQAAGMLLVEEAGGRVTDRTGNPTDYYTRSIVATNGRMHDTLVAILEGEK